MSEVITEEDTRKEKPVCIIPARKNSKRLKNKNKLLLNGKPLVLYAIEAAKDSELFSRILVSSDDIEILELAYKNKVYPHKRPPALAKDKVGIKDVCFFILRILGRNLPEQFCILSPANPFRTAGDVKNAYKILMEGKGDIVMSVVKYSHPPQWALEKKGHFVVPLFGEALKEQSQRLKPLYRHEGSIIFVKTRAFLKNFNAGFYGCKVMPYVMEQSVDIDTGEDFAYAEFLKGRGGGVVNRSSL